MEIHSHGTKGDFRKISITLPPTIYKLLLEESTRRKIAGAEDSLLSAIARDGILGTLSLLPNEQMELKIYQYADQTGSGEWHEMSTLSDFASAVCGRNQNKALFQQLVAHLMCTGYLEAKKFDQNQADYRPFGKGDDPINFLSSRVVIKIRLTIPGRRRFEALQARQELAGSPQ
jgi:hypothetical protein